MRLIVERVPIPTESESLPTKPSGISIKYFNRMYALPSRVYIRRLRLKEKFAPSWNMFLSDKPFPFLWGSWHTKAETPLRLHVWPYVTGPTQKFLRRTIFFVAKSTGSDRKRQVASGGAHVVHGFFVIRTCAKTCHSRGNAGRAAMFMRLRFRFSNSLC